MIIDHEEHRKVLLAAIEALPISGPACHPDLLANVKLANEVRAAILSATMTMDPVLAGYADR
jgi:hypothetical protein